jgi:hypothetical protein
LQLSILRIGSELKRWNARYWIKPCPMSAVG